MERDSLTNKHKEIQQSSFDKSVFFVLPCPLHGASICGGGTRRGHEGGVIRPNADENPNAEERRPQSRPVSSRFDKQIRTTRCSFCLEIDQSGTRNATNKTSHSLNFLMEERDVQIRCMYKQTGTGIKNKTSHKTDRRRDKSLKEEKM